MVLHEAILKCFMDKQKPMTIQEVDIYISRQYKQKWKDVGTTLADMVPISYGGNTTSTVPDEYRKLKRLTRGTYTLIE
ncbi:hypothetical protein SAMN04487943_102302 [Gracilibacillus orientalis]|uniref:Uncharacterized protein n=1 Tax=Gracilibacillus orientalis TaxID=334253 RepID=A0A1I4IV24_9BACI|nr:hypothetical protein [Gracilibacillus orientalis]SFL57917.1 hypothetical protein SAMN04487943_102302 [Gracilibacillus orientalis]